MTEPKTPRTSTGPGRSKAAEAPAAPESQEELLRQLTVLAAAVEKLARGGPPPRPGEPPGPCPPPDPDADERRRVQFAYEFLGEVLGRRGQPAFAVPRVTVTRDRGRLTFTELRGGTVARLRARDGTTDVLEELREGVAAQTSIPDEQPIDSIVVLDGRDGPAVAIGPCLAPLPPIIIE